VERSPTPRHTTSAAPPIPITLMMLFGVKRIRQFSHPSPQLAIAATFRPKPANVALLGVHLERCALAAPRLRFVQLPVKKLIVEEKWKRYLAARSRSQVKANARFSGHRRDRAESAIGRPRVKQFRKDGRVEGPQVFSLIENPDDTIAFFRELEDLASTRNVYVDLSSVKTITPDAIAVLVAIIRRSQHHGARIRGNVPEETVAQQMLNDSGFRAYVTNSPGYRPPPAMGKILKRTATGEVSQNRFDQHLARTVIEFATEKITGVAQPHRPSFSVFCEAMLNTWNHAAGIRVSHEPWWASVYCDGKRRRASFTFVDLGVGIFRSHRLTMALKLLNTMRLLDHGQLLGRIFQGQIPSTTRLPGRGNGIPGMYEHCKAGRIRRFTVLANDAIGDGESDNYRQLSATFPGTLIYWEIEL
jgi:anti-anti-sigma regulatory factor